MMKSSLLTIENYLDCIISKCKLAVFKVFSSKHVWFLLKSLGPNHHSLQSCTVLCGPTQFPLKSVGLVGVKASLQSRDGYFHKLLLSKIAVMSSRVSLPTSKKNYLHNGAFLSNFVILSMSCPDFMKYTEDALN